LNGECRIFGLGLSLAFAVLAAATGRSLPGRWSVQDLVTVTIATHKLPRTVPKDAATSPLRASFARCAGSGAEVHPFDRGHLYRPGGGRLFRVAYARAQQITEG
jgi:hypothetical protein